MFKAFELQCSFFNFLHAFNIVVASTHDTNHILSFDLFRKIVPLDEYFEDLRTGTLPAVSYIVPSGASEHPPGSIRAGQSFVKVLIQELMKSNTWNESAFIWSYDDWGGWYDHVNPPRVDAYGYGFRAPAMLVSPYAKRGFIDSTEYDFTSPIKFITENWDLAPLAQRDRNANSIIYAFDFTQPPRLPILIPAKRPAYVPKREPRRLPVYLAYSGALFFASLVIAIAHIVDARAQRAAPPSDKDQGILF